MLLMLLAVIAVLLLLLWADYNDPHGGIFP